MRYYSNFVFRVCFISNFARTYVQYCLLLSHCLIRPHKHPHQKRIGFGFWVCTIFALMLILDIITRAILTTTNILTKNLLGHISCFPSQIHKKQYSFSHRLTSRVIQRHLYLLLLLQSHHFFLNFFITFFFLLLFA